MRRWSWFWNLDWPRNWVYSANYNDTIAYLYGVHFSSKHNILSVRSAFRSDHNFSKNTTATCFPTILFEFVFCYYNIATFDWLIYVLQNHHIIFLTRYQYPNKRAIFWIIQSTSRRCWWMPTHYMHKVQTLFNIYYGARRKGVRTLNKCVALYSFSLQNWNLISIIIIILLSNERYQSAALCCH